MAKNYRVQFHFIAKNLKLQERNRLKNYILTLFRREHQHLSSLHYIFCSDAALLEMNRQFLNHDYYTDIITFTLSEKGYPIDAEIYISLDRVRDNATLLKQTYKRELHRVIFHGALHLCGYKDKTKQEVAIMRKKEEYNLKLYLD